MVLGCERPPPDQRSSGRCRPLLRWAAPYVVRCVVPLTQRGVPLVHGIRSLAPGLCRTGPLSTLRPNRPAGERILAVGLRHEGHVLGRGGVGPGQAGVPWSLSALRAASGRHDSATTACARLRFSPIACDHHDDTSAPGVLLEKRQMQPATRQGLCQKWHETRCNHGCGEGIKRSGASRGLAVHGEGSTLPPAANRPRGSIGGRG